jgi:flagellin
MTVINTNLNSLMAKASLDNVNAAQSKAMQRLSTGLRINSAADDAVGLAIANRMTSQINGYAVAIRNSNDGISMAQTADGAMSQITSMLQRMRDLALASTNGTMTDADRSSSQQEVTQLKAQIQDIATQTNHNGINLLDGSAGAINLQTGTNANDTMTMGFASMQTKDIGLGTNGALSSLGGLLVTNTVNDGLIDGSLTLNGVAVGASIALTDTLSSTQNDASAIAKAAAINAVSAQSGVFATVDKTTVSGTGVVPNGTSAANMPYGTVAAPAAGTVLGVNINGVETATFYSTGNTQLDRAATVKAINAISARTGVTAIDTGDDNQGISLSAADGRNITLAQSANSTVTSQQLGMAAAGTYVGSYSLSTKDGSSITVGSSVANYSTTEQLAGLHYGTYGPNVSTVVTGVRAPSLSTASPSPADAGVLLGGTLTINGVGIAQSSAADDSASYQATGTTSRASSAIAIAAAINKSTNMTGVTATAQANVIEGTAFTAGVVTAVTLNGVNINMSLGTNSSRNDVLAAINAYTGQTGVTAVVNGGGVQLVAADGRNIDIGVTGSGGAAALGLVGTSVSSTDQTYYASVKLTSDKTFTVDSGAESDNANFKALGFTEGTFGGSGTGAKIADIDISTIQGATVALTSIDAALTTVANNQSAAGAYENRLNATVDNLATANTNMSAARSRIQDADYGTETTNLAKAQIIQQAATAMLAQANQSTQTVLSLLK